jgi:hypothetical protein
MNLDRIRERRSNGFQAFVIELPSGKRSKVPHPDFISIEDSRQSARRSRK